VTTAAVFEAIEFYTSGCRSSGDEPGAAKPFLLLKHHKARPSSPARQGLPRHSLVADDERSRLRVILEELFTNIIERLWMRTVTLRPPSLLPLWKSWSRPEGIAVGDPG
jgi:hypothetical protein